jgi:hypothetical protein
MKDELRFPKVHSVPGGLACTDNERRAYIRSERDAWYAHAYGLTRDELRYILDPADVKGPDYPSETFRVLKKNEIARAASIALPGWCCRRGTSCNRGADMTRTFAVASEDALIDLISSARNGLVVIAPALTHRVAGAALSHVAGPLQAVLCQQTPSPQDTARLGQASRPANPPLAPESVHRAGRRQRVCGRGRQPCLCRDPLECRALQIDSGSVFAK